MNEEQKKMLISLAADYAVPIELAKAMAALMTKYPDLSQWGSKTNLKNDLEKIVESAFTEKLI